MTSADLTPPGFEKLSKNVNIKAASLALLLFVYAVFMLSTFEFQYVETVQRISINKTFDYAVFGSRLADNLVLVGSLVVFLASSTRPTWLRSAIVIGFSAATAALMITSMTILELFGIATLPILASLLLFGFLIRHFSLDRSHHMMPSIRVSPKRVLSFLLIILITLEVAALMRWVTYPMWPSQIYADGSWQLAELESGLFHAFGLLSPIMVTALALSFLFKDSIRNLFVKSKLSYTPIDTNLAKMQSMRQVSDESLFPAESLAEKSNAETSLEFRKSVGKKHSVTEISSNLRLARIILVSAVILSAATTIYPHLPGVNGSGTGISTDERAYIDWLANFRKLEAEGSFSTPFEFISSVFSNRPDRPLAILLIVGLSNISGIADADIVRFLPTLVAPLLVLASYCLVRYGYSEQSGQPGSLHRIKFVAALVALAAAFSPQIVVGLYGGFLANWLAIVPSFFAIIFAAKLVDAGREGINNSETARRIPFYAVSLFGCLSLVMLFHVYTWGFVILVSIAFVIFSLVVIGRLHSGDRRRNLQLVAIIAGVILASIGSDFARSYYFSANSGLATDSFVAGRNFGLDNFDSKWETMESTLTVYLGGLLSHPWLMLFSLFWVFKSNHMKGFDRFLISMLSVLSLPMLFGTSVIQARFLYMIPLYVTGVLGISSIKTTQNELTRLAIIFTVSSLAVYALRAMANLYLVLPDGYILENEFLVP